MKLFLSLLLLTSCGFAQIPATSIRRDTVPEVFPPDVNLPDPMPNARPNNSFYRYHAGRSARAGATLDNMPVKIPDSSTHYTMLRSFRKFAKPEQPPIQFLKPMRPVLPRKKF